MREQKVSVRLSVQDWQAIIKCLHRHADVGGYNAATTAVEIGRERLRYIAAHIKEKIKVQ